MDGRVPFAVICPTCKADATEFANAHVAQQLGVPAQQAAAESVAAEPAASEPGRPRLRIGRAAHASAPTVAEPEAAVAALAAAPAPRPAPVMPVSAAYSNAAYSNLTPPDEGLTAKFFYGVGGAVVGTALGCLIWYLIFHFTGKSWRIFALLAGAGGGFGARIASKDEGSSQLGMITCVVVLCGIVFTAYTIGKDRLHGFADGIVGGLYKDQLNYAKRAVKAVPTGADDEIRAFLAKEESDSDVKIQPTAIKAHEVRIFRDVHLAQYKELADGKISEHDYPKTLARWGFDERVAEAKVALDAMPHESDKEIREYLAAEAVEEPGQKPDPQAVTAEEIAAFKNETLPEYKKLASGETKYVELPDVVQTSRKTLDKVEEENGWMRVIYFFSGWGIGGIGLMFVTIGLAYKTSTHASG
ncbi:MAG: hypothetical protein ACXWKG_00345 [Limisphaerales bacterium]